MALYKVKAIRHYAQKVDLFIEAPDEQAAARFAPSASSKIPDSHWTRLKLTVVTTGDVEPYTRTKPFSDDSDKLVAAMHESCVRLGYLSESHLDRQFIEAVVFKYRTSTPWRKLPDWFGDFRKTAMRYYNWRKRKFWRYVVDDLKLLGIVDFKAGYDGSLMWTGGQCECSVPTRS